jgi:hypothetical protein
MALWRMDIPPLNGEKAGGLSVPAPIKQGVGHQSGDRKGARVCERGAFCLRSDEAL